MYNKNLKINLGFSFFYLFYYLKSLTGKYIFFFYEVLTIEDSREGYSEIINLRKAEGDQS